MVDPRKTLSVDDEAPSAALPRSPYLFVVMHAGDPKVRPARYALGGATEVLLARAGGSEAPERGRLVVPLEDGRVSQSHARLVKEAGRWVFEDLGSKNGSFVDGERAGRALLDDGAILELGHTFLRFRADLPEALAVDRDALAGLATLLPDLERSFARLAQLAPSTVPVVLRGESGTGKEVVARALHALSRRRGPFIAVNCGAIPANLVEGQLFGHRRGAFSGAHDDQPGLIRSADGGTLFLDEIGELPPAAQAPFLRVLQEREVLPVGASRAVPVDFRVVAATHRDLPALVAKEQFRLDLWNRLAAFELELPSLHERLEDFGLIAAALGSPPLGVRTARALLAYPWPGNVRELEHVLTTSRLLAGDGPLLVEHLPPHVAAAADTALDADGLRHREEVLALLRAHGGNIAAVARACGKARMQVQRWIKKYGIRAEDFRGSR